MLNSSIPTLSLANSPEHFVEVKCFHFGFYLSSIVLYIASKIRSYFSHVVNPDIANQYKHIISKLYNQFVTIYVLYVIYVIYIFLWCF